MRFSRVRTLRPLATTLTVFASLLATQISLMAQTSPAATKTEADDDIIQLEKFKVEALKEFSDQVQVGKSPIAVSEVTKEKISDQLASRDIPFALASTPSFYVTNQGGGAGDSRLSVRGFNQRNVSILINGVPTNDNENGWLYWSNWDGLGDATQSIQLQRGLSYSTLPTPSIGGTLNVITDPAAAKMGASIKYEQGSDDFMKETIAANTGLLANKFAASVNFTNKEGDGYTRGTYTEAKGYYVGLSYQINKTNRLEFYGISAPQTHGQASYQQNIATLDADYARKLGYTDAQLALFPLRGRRYNQRQQLINSSYSGQQWYWGKAHPRQEAAWLDEAENYYDKPQVNLNWFLDISQELKLSTVVYWSGGRGGGGGSYNNASGKASTVTGETVTAYTIPTFSVGASGDNQYSYDNIIADNAASTKGSRFVLRNSTNYQNTYGAVVKLAYTPTSNLRFSTGLDARTAKIDHWYEIRDLLGGAYYRPTTAQWIHKVSDTTNSTTLTNVQLHLGDKTDYYYTNNIDWLGTFAQAQYETKKMSAFAVLGYTMSDYKFTNHWVLNDDGSERKLSAPQFKGYQVKGGVQYTIVGGLAAYANAGWVSKAPYHSYAIYYTGAGRVMTGIQNEKFTTYESGLRYTTNDKKLTVSAGYYFTSWRNRTATSSKDNVTFSDKSVGTSLIFQTGINSIYNGVEVESAYQPYKFIRFDAALSVNNWYYTGDGHQDTYKQSGGTLESSTLISLKSVKVGDAPQSQLALSSTVYPSTGLSVTGSLRWADRYYAGYTPESRTNDYGQSWRLPSSRVVDLHVNYKLPLHLRFDVSLFVHVLNVLDEVYIQDATDNYFTVTGAAAHSAQVAEVYMGTPRTWTAGAKIAF